MKPNRTVTASLLIIGLCVGALAVLSRVTRDSPRPLKGVARLRDHLEAAFVPRRFRKKARLTDLTGAERAAMDTLATRLDGLIVWASNRGGTHALYVLDPRRRSVRQLTKQSRIDFFGRISPDGRQIVFVRSQRESVSARDLHAWDLYLIAVDGTGERRIAVGGIHPTWTPDGAGIIFHRGPRVFRYDVATGRERLVFDAASELPGIDDDLGDVELASDGQRLAFVLRGTFSGAHGLRGAVSGAAVFDLEARRLTLLAREQACQTTWTPDGTRVLWMETGGNGGTRIMAGRPNGSERRVFMDLPGPRSHEYFPKLSNDGRWLIWGATAEGHEQDQADYEIFAWEIGTPWEQAARITHQPGNDNWPDLWVRR